MLGTMTRYPDLELLIHANREVRFSSEVHRTEGGIVTLRGRCGSLVKTQLQLVLRNWHIVEQEWTAWSLAMAASRFWGGRCRTSPALWQGACWPLRGGYSPMVCQVCAGPLINRLCGASCPLGPEPWSLQVAALDFSIDLSTMGIHKSGLVGEHPAVSFIIWIFIW